MSVLNTSVLSSGTIGDGTGSWLVSGRRSNLEDVVHERLGEPAYYDFFGELGINFSERTHVSVNALTARDRVLLVTEADPTEARAIVKRHAQQPFLGSLATAMVGTSSRARRHSRAVRFTACAARQRTTPRRSSPPSGMNATSALPAFGRTGSGLSALPTRCLGARSTNGKPPTTITLRPPTISASFLLFPTFRLRCAAARRCHRTASCSASSSRTAGKLRLGPQRSSVCAGTNTDTPTRRLSGS